VSPAEIWAALEVSKQGVMDKLRRFAESGVGGKDRQ
jgi:hypothetical protein